MARRGLGRSASVHRELLTPRLTTARRLAASADGAIDRGDCKNAASALLQAAASWGSYGTHSEASGTKAPGENATSNEYWRVRRRFMATCVRQKGSA